MLGNYVTNVPTVFSAAAPPCSTNIRCCTRPADSPAYSTSYIDEQQSFVAYQRINQALPVTFLPPMLSRPVPIPEQPDTGVIYQTRNKLPLATFLPPMFPSGRQLPDIRNKPLHSVIRQRPYRPGPALSSYQAIAHPQQWASEEVASNAWQTQVRSQPHTFLPPLFPRSQRFDLVDIPVTYQVLSHQTQFGPIPSPHQAIRPPQLSDYALPDSYVPYEQPIRQPITHPTPPLYLPIPWQQVSVEYAAWWETQTKQPLPSVVAPTLPSFTIAWVGSTNINLIWVGLTNTNLTW